MPHFGQSAAQVAVISSCIGHRKAVGAAVSAGAGMSFIPHFGHFPAQVATTSSSIGQAQTPVSTPSPPTSSISATKERLLSGGASRIAPIRSRSASRLR